jgi:hypothetical protein
MAHRPPSAQARRRPSRALPRRARSEEAQLLQLFDDKVEEYTVSDWHARNLKLVEVLQTMGVLDREVVPQGTHRALTDHLIHVLNGAAIDPQNAGHVRAQNENVLHYGIAAGLDPQTLAIVLEAGLIHDLNKAVGEPLRQDDFGVRDHRGRLVPIMTTMAQIVGLNHLGERTRRAIDGATRLKSGKLAPEIARRIDLTIVHHGLGSSRFIQDLIDGKNSWWGEEFVEPETHKRKLVHPPQPPLTLESLINDLADSTQQMQGGAAWLLKYPAGFWRASGRSLADMISGREQGVDQDIPMSLRLQIAVETETCHAIIGQALDASIIGAELSVPLIAAIQEAIESSERWIEDSPEYLARKDGESVYHDVARALGISAEEARARMLQAEAGTPERDDLDALVFDSGRRVDLDRARALVKRLLEPGRALG